MGRSPFSPYPSLGLPPGWRISDLSPSYSTPYAVITAASANQTSAAYNPQANSIELSASFSDATTKCDLAVQSDDGSGTFTTVHTFTGVDSLHNDRLILGEWPNNISLHGRQIKIAIQNYSGSGSVTVSVRRLN